MSALELRGRIVVVTPVFEDREASARLFAELGRQFGARVFVLAVDDGSVQQPLCNGVLASAGVSGRIVRLKRNVGHQRAIAIGLSHAVEAFDAIGAIVVMDCDGEDRPDGIGALLEKLEVEGTDVVVALRRARVESLRFRIFYRLYRWLFEGLSGRRIAFGNFMAMSPAAALRLASMQELWTHLAACVLASRLRVVQCPLDRGLRYAGDSRMNFVSLVLHGFRALMVFAEDVLVRVGIASAAIAGLSIVAGAAAVTLKLLGIATPGWFSVAIGILLLVFLQVGTVTLLALMLTGLIRSGAITTMRYHDYIASLHDESP